MALEYAGRGVYGKKLSAWLDHLTPEMVDEYVFYNGTRRLEGDGALNAVTREDYRSLRSSGVGVGANSASDSVKWD